MSVFNYGAREVNVKVVYYGPGLSGKTTNIQHVHNSIRPDLKGKLVSLATQTDRTLFFDFLPLELGSLSGYKIRLHLYTVPGQVHYNATRKLVLQGVDGIVFVADSQRTMKDANIESFRNLQSNIESYGKSLQSLPHVIQGNKRDLDDLLSMEEINSNLNSLGAPLLEAVASEGTGVLECLREILRLVMRTLKDKFPMEEMEDEGAQAHPETVQPEPSAQRAAPPPVPEPEPTAPAEVTTQEMAAAPAAGGEAVETDPSSMDPPSPDPVETTISAPEPIRVDVSSEMAFTGGEKEVTTRVDVPGVGEVEVKVFIQVEPADAGQDQLPSEPVADPVLVELPEESPPFHGAPPDMPAIEEPEPVLLDEHVEDLEELEGEVLDEEKVVAVEEEELEAEVGDQYDPSFKEFEFADGAGGAGDGAGETEGKRRSLKDLFRKKK